jgi:hypothetical protein
MPWKEMQIKTKENEMKNKKNKMFRVYFDDGLISYTLDERFNSKKSAWDFIKSSTYVDDFYVEELKYQHIEVS